MLFDKDPLSVLQDSIDKVGILVPLTVYWSDERDSFVILDGQRRWMCAQYLKLREVPVNQVAEPSIVQNIVTMFQIHKFREDWELMPTALKLEVLMNELEERNGKKLAALTGLDQAVVTRCKKLLTYPKKYQDLMLDEDPAERVKADFFIELYPVLNDRFVVSQAWYSRDGFTRRMLEKYLANASGIKSVTDFRKIKQHISNAVRVHGERAISIRLRQFLEDDTLQISHLSVPAASVSAGARKVLRVVTELTDTLRLINADEYYGEEELWNSLDSLMRLIRSKLIEAGRRPKE
jgi:ParB/RepB/Spo0J family partition protein